MSLECYHCKSERVAYKFQLGKYALQQCPDCDLVFLYPQPNDTEVSNIYDERYLGIFQEEDQEHVDRMKKTAVDLYIEELVAYTKGSNLRLLEIGAGGGDFLLAAQKKGFDVNGIEISEKAVSHANEKLGGNYVTLGSLDTLDLSSLGTFDVCVMFNIIEYVRDPSHFILQVRSILNENGVLFIITPSMDTWSAKLLKSKWMAYRSERLFYFNTQNLEAFLVKSGFKNMVTLPNCKILNYEYIERHMRRFHIPFFSPISKQISKVVPKYIKQKNFKVVISGMSSICRKADLPPEKPKLSIIMPVFNEKQTFSTALEQVLSKELPQVEKEIVIVESNSTDGTKEEVARYENCEGVKVIYEERPRGKGHAVRTGLNEASGDIILIQDADLEYDVNDYDQLLEPLLKYQKMFVLGSRHTGDWKMRSFEDRKLLSTLFNFGQILFTWMINVACGSELKDPFTMYKVFRKECLYGLKFEANRFDFDWEIVIKFLRKKYFPLEIPVNYSSRSFTEGKKVSLIKDPILWMKALFKFRFGKLRQNLS